MKVTVSPRIGVLALQGDAREHLAALREVGADAVPVRVLAELDAVDGLVIPGGESTTMSHLLLELSLLEPLRERLADGLPAYGACAGMILLADEILDAGAGGRAAVPLGAIDMTVRRNAFGRQVDSFEGDLTFAGLDDPVHAVFIRAPWVERTGPGVEVLARAAGHVVAVRQGRVLATAFHPEMTGDRRIHRLFVEIGRIGRDVTIGPVSSINRSTAWRDIPGWFQWRRHQEEAAAHFPDGSWFVEVGCYLGRSICSLAEVVRGSHRTTRIIGVDTARGSGPEGRGEIDAHGSAVAHGGGTFAGLLHRNIIGCGFATPSNW